MNSTCACIATDRGMALRRLSAAADNVALSLIGDDRSPSNRRGGRSYADGYFAGLCFALGVLVDESPAAVATRALGRHSLR